MSEWPFPAIDPVLLPIYGSFGLRYYGLMYVVGFIAGQAILVRLARQGFLPMAPSKVGDLIFYLILGVVLGGRLGHCIFYNPEIWSNPVEIFKVWEGGLSFHGGLIGVVISFVWFCKKHDVPVWRMVDATALAVCPGIFAVRCANFINGELVGRIIQPAKGDWNPPWAMRFPTDPAYQHVYNLPPGLSKREVELKILEIYRSPEWETLKQKFPLRHPSQIYEALAEGLILGLILFLLYRRHRAAPLGAGAYGGIFLMGYGVMRFCIEYFRQPDAQFESEESKTLPVAERLGTVLAGLSMGQLLCIGMMLFAGWMLWGARSRPTPLRKVEDPEEEASGSKASA